MRARHALVTALVIGVAFAGYEQGRDVPPTVRTVEVPVVERTTVPTPLPESCADAATLIAEMASDDATLSEGAGRLQRVIDQAERALQDGDYPAYNTAMREVRDVRSLVATAATSRQAMQPRLDKLSAQCSDDTQPTTGG